MWQAGPQRWLRKGLSLAHRLGSIGRMPWLQTSSTSIVHHSLRYDTADFFPCRAVPASLVSGYGYCLTRHRDSIGARLQGFRDPDATSDMAPPPWSTGRPG